MKKAGILFVLILILSLFGCGKANAEQEPSVPMENSGADVKGAGIEVVQLTPDTVYTLDGDYAVSGLYSDILTDGDVAEGWYYYYSTGTESPAPVYDWVCAEGMHTSCELMYDLKNLKQSMDAPFMDRFRGFIVYNMEQSVIPEGDSAYSALDELREAAAGSPSAKLFEFTCLQRNPGQLDTDGYETRSKDAVLLGAGEAAQQDIIADVSTDFLRSWESGSEPMWAVFAYDDATLFTVDLRLYMRTLAES